MSYETDRNELVRNPLIDKLSKSIGIKLQAFYELGESVVSRFFLIML